jgi:hypothetical protein
LHALHGESPRGMAAVERLYLSSFPSSERKPASFVRAAAERSDYEVLSFGQGREADAFAILYRPREPFVLIEYLAVDANVRDGGLGSEVVERIAERHCGRALIVEVEDDIGEAEGQAAARKRFYRKLHFGLIEGLQYRMPQVADTAPPPMHLMIRGAGEAITKATLARWLIDIFSGVYAVRNPSATVEYMLRASSEKFAIS